MAWIRGLCTIDLWKKIRDHRSHATVPLKITNSCKSHLMLCRHRPRRGLSCCRRRVGSLAATLAMKSCYRADRPDPAAKAATSLSPRRHPPAPPPLWRILRLLLWGWVHRIPQTTSLVSRRRRGASQLSPAVKNLSPPIRSWLTMKRRRRLSDWWWDWFRRWAAVGDPHRRLGAVSATPANSGHSWKGLRKCKFTQFSNSAFCTTLLTPVLCPKILTFKFAATFKFLCWIQILFFFDCFLKHKSWKNCTYIYG